MFKNMLIIINKMEKLYLKPEETVLITEPSPGAVLEGQGWESPHCDWGSPPVTEGVTYPTQARS